MFSDADGRSMTSRSNGKTFTSIEADDAFLIKLKVKQPPSGPIKTNPGFTRPGHPYSIDGGFVLTPRLMMSGKSSSRAASWMMLSTAQRRHILSTVSLLMQMMKLRHLRLRAYRPLANRPKRRLHVTISRIFRTGLSAHVVLPPGGLTHAIFLPILSQGAPCLFLLPTTVSHASPRKRSSLALSASCTRVTPSLLRSAM